MNTDERINSLLERANMPILIRTSDKKRKPYFEDVRRISAVVLDMLEGDAYIDDLEALARSLSTEKRDLINLVEVLVAALENVLNERDQLLKDVSGTCEVCKNLELPGYCEPCSKCGFHDSQGFEWIGLRDES